LMAVKRAKYYTPSEWLFDEPNEKHIYEVQWLLTIDLNTDSPQDDIQRKFVL
jgi:hypothetical protein